MFDSRLPWLAAILAAVLLVVSLGWWWLVFGTITAAGTISMLDAATCLAADTDLCRLAEAICTNDHFIDIRWYAPEIFWATMATAAIALLSLFRGTPPDPVR